MIIFKPAEGFSIESATVVYICFPDLSEWGLIYTEKSSIICQESSTTKRNLRDPGSRGTQGTLTKKLD